MSKHNNRLIASILLMLAILGAFWGASRYPDLMEEYTKADLGQIVDRNMGALSKDEAVSTKQATSNIQQVWTNTANWLFENKWGMGFALLFGGAILLISENLRRYPKVLNQSGIRGSLSGLLLGSPLGVCTNCAAPIGISLKKSGASAELIYTTVVASPMLNPIGLLVLFALFPLPMVGLRLLAVGFIIFAIVPLLTRGFANNVIPNPASSCPIDEGPQTEKITHTVAYTFMGWFRNVIKLIYWVVPIMVGVALLVSALLAYVPLESLALQDSYQWHWIVVAAAIGVIIPIPMLFDLVLVYFLMTLGISDAVAITLLVTMPAVSLFNASVLGKYVSPKISIAMMVSVFFVGIICGLIMLETNKINPVDRLTSIEKTQVSDATKGYSLTQFAPQQKITSPTQLFKKEQLSTVSNDFLEKLKFSAMIDFSYTMTKTAGVSFSDVNQDGWIDLFAVQEGKPILYMNDGTGKFNDVSKNVFPDVDQIASGVWADYDNDGDLDIILTRYGDFQKDGTRFRPAPLSNILLQNQNGKFVDVSQQAGITEKGFSQGAAWGDMDGDGDLDLFIANYGTISPGQVEHFEELEKQNELPQLYHDGQHDRKILTLAKEKDPAWVGTPQSDFLYRNNGNGTFTNVAKDVGIPILDKKVRVIFTKPTVATLVDYQYSKQFIGFSFQPVWLDYDNDGDMDIFLATDFAPSVLYINKGDGTFKKSPQSIQGVEANSTMGTLVLDFNGDGFFDIYEIRWGQNRLLINKDGQYFKPYEDATEINDGAKISWGAAYQDFDANGSDDLLVGNGNFSRKPMMLQATAQKVRSQIQSQNSLYMKAGESFRNHGTKHGISTYHLTRGVAAGDVNNDGLIDVAVNNIDEGVSVYINQGGAGHTAVVQLEGNGSNAYAIGAKVSARINGQWQHKLITAGSSFMSQDSPWVHFGLGDAKKIDELVVVWTNGDKRVFKDVPADHRILVKQLSPKITRASNHEGTSH